MNKVRILRANGKPVELDGGVLEEFVSGLRGSFLTATDNGYEEARAVWNAMIDRRPAAIVRCAGVADVVRSVRFAKTHDLLLAVRGGGHNIAGNAVCDDGLVVDLSSMRSVRVDTAAKVAHVEPGATLGDLDHETQAFGLATPVGINSTTGVAGLTLGGGFGWLSRKWGMTVDNLIAVDVVNASGELVRASEKENSDLFWALRGGGGNFGVVTRFEFRLHAVGPEVYAGLVVFPFDQAKSILRKYRTFTETLPEESSVWVVLRKAPPLPFLSADVHGKEVVVLAMCHTGDSGRGEKVHAAIRQFGTPHGEHVGVMPFAAWQKAFDPLLTPGARNYWKSHNFTALDDAVLDAAVEYAGKLSSPHSEIFIGLLGGATERVAADAMAYGHRNARFVINVHGRWETPAEDSAGVAWARAFFDASAPYATGGVYVNFMTADEGDRIPSGAYGPNYKRLVQLKEKYDPGNRFRLNQNIVPGT